MKNNPRQGLKSCVYAQFGIEQQRLVEFNLS